MKRKPARIVVQHRNGVAHVASASRNDRGVHYLVDEVQVQRRGVSKKAYRSAMVAAIAQLMGESTEK